MIQHNLKFKYISKTLSLCVIPTYILYTSKHQGGNTEYGIGKKFHGRLIMGINE